MQVCLNKVVFIQSISIQLSELAGVVLKNLRMSDEPLLLFEDLPVLRVEVRALAFLTVFRFEVLGCDFKVVKESLNAGDELTLVDCERLVFCEL